MKLRFTFALVGLMAASGVHPAAADRAELEGVSAERAPQIVAGALVAEASMNALAVESVDICPWALREGLILRKLDSEADGTALVETSVRDAGREVARPRGNTR